MKKQIIISTAAACLVLMAGCRKECPPEGGRNGELTIAPRVGEPATIASRAAGDSFFVAGESLDVSIRANDETQSTPYVYTYQPSGIFTGQPPYHFPMNDSYIATLTALWPGGDIRSLGMRTDQRTAEVFRQSDWMTARAEASGIMPTDRPVPLTFVRENCMLEFELTGQNGIGVDILELTIELQVDGVPTAFKAYCSPTSDNARLIVKPGTKISSPDRYMIGIVKASESTQYTIIFPQTDLTLERGYRYLVTLSPEGYNMSVFAVIQGWNDGGQDGIGIPFQQPEPMPDGSYLIDTPLRLVTMSYLMRHYTDGTTTDWPSQDYILPATLSIPQEIADKYVPISSGLFSGTMKDEEGNPVTTVATADGGTLALFETQEP